MIYIALIEEDVNLKNSSTFLSIQHQKIARLFSTFPVLIRVKHLSQRFIGVEGGIS
jgi:hypothetical protein